MVGPNDFNDREQGAKFDGDDTSSESHSSAYRNVAINDAKRGGQNQSNLPKSGSFDGDRDDMNDDKDTKAVVAYRDYSKDQPSPLDNSSSFGREGSTQTFPMKLHAILLNPEFVDIIAWLPHGRAWRILQMKAFEEQVIPLYFRYVFLSLQFCVCFHSLKIIYIHIYFRHGRYSSFARQVNGWGFRRITHGPDYNSYYHEKFLKGLPYLCDKMKRLTSEDIKRMQKDNFVLPDFYALSRDCPLPDSKAGDSMLQMPFRTSMPESQAPASAFSINPSLLSHAAAGLSLPTPATLKPTIPSGIAASPADINFLLSMNLGSARGSQQQNMETESAWLNALSSWNKLSLQIKGTSGVIADPSSNSDLHSLEARRNEIIQRLMCSGGQGNAPAPSASSPFPSSARAGQIGNGDAYLISQLRDLLNPKTSKDGVDGVLNLKPDQIASLLQNFWHTLAPSVNSYSAQAPSSNLADLSNTLIGRDIFHLLGQQGLNPTVLANIRTLLPMTSNQSQTMRESSFALRAPSDSVDQDVDHSLTQKQLSHEPTNNTAPPSSFNNPSVGENDLVSLVRQLQKSSTKRRPY